MAVRILACLDTASRSRLSLFLSLEQRLRVLHNLASRASRVFCKRETKARVRATHLPLNAAGNLVPSVDDRERHPSITKNECRLGADLTVDARDLATERATYVG